LQKVRKVYRKVFPSALRKSVEIVFEEIKKGEGYVFCNGTYVHTHRSDLRALNNTSGTYVCFSTRNRLRKPGKGLSLYGWCKGSSYGLLRLTFDVVKE
jgi:hypothetical protein